MARGRTGPVVSLFAFQDIITAVSGILIVVVLLLALELVEQPQAEASSTDHQAESIQEALRSAEAERDQLRLEIASAAEFTQEAAGTSASALRSEITELGATQSQLKQRLHELKSEAAQIEEAKASLEVRKFDSADTVAKFAENQAEIARLEQEIEEAKSSDRVVYTLPKGFRKTGWLVVIAGEELATAPIGVAAAPKMFDSLDAFLSWAAARHTDYFLLLIRPSGTDRFSDVEDVFRLQGIAYGYDVVGRDQEVLHPERGAAP